MTFLLAYLNVNFNFNFNIFVYGSWICIFFMNTFGKGFIAAVFAGNAIDIMLTRDNANNNIRH